MCTLPTQLPANQRLQSQQLVKYLIRLTDIQLVGWWVSFYLPSDKKFVVFYTDGIEGRVADACLLFIRVVVCIIRVVHTRLAPPRHLVR